jgi:hypothetical protein
LQRFLFIRFTDKTLSKDLRGRFVPDEAEDEGGLPPVKDENEVWRESGRKE